MASARVAAAQKAAKETKAQEAKATKTAVSKTKAPAKPANKAAAKPSTKAASKEAPKAPVQKAASEPKVSASKKRKAEEETANNSSTKKAKTAAPVAKADAKKPAAKKAAAPKKETKEAVPKAVVKKVPAKTTSKKVKKEASEDEVSDAEEETKKTPSRPKKTAAARAPAPATAPAPRVRKAGAKINDAPTQRLEVFVFGEGSSGELGMGSKRRDGKKPVDVKRPRYNDLISAKGTGVVQLACGGMHVAALTADGKMLTWGVNDDGALGRDTNWDGGLVDMDKAGDSDSDSDDDDDTGVNPKESTPTEVITTDFIEGTKVVQVVACDSATFALTEDGRVYGWGTFRASDGILGFNETIKAQRTPYEIKDLKNIKLLASGSNHVLAIDVKGEITAWGSGEQAQLGRRIGERYKMKALLPQHVGVPKSKTAPVVKMAAGSYHSFALTSEGKVYGWGLNNFGQVGVELGAGEGDALVQAPHHIKSLSGYKIKDIAGGEHHSIACTEDGKLLVWGRIDGHQVGLPREAFTEENTVFDENNRPRILFKPTVVEGIPEISSVAAGTDTSFAVTKDGKAYTWGFSANYQTGLGTTDDIETPTLIDNTAVREKKVVFAGAGGQFSVLMTLPDDAVVADSKASSAEKTADDDKENKPVSA